MRNSLQPIWNLAFIIAFIAAILSPGINNRAKLPEGATLTVLTTIDSITEIDGMIHGYDYNTTWLYDSTLNVSDVPGDTVYIRHIDKIDTVEKYTGTFVIVTPYFTDTVFASQPTLDQYGVYSARVKNLAFRSIEAIMMLEGTEWKKLSYKFR